MQIYLYDGAYAYSPIKSFQLTVYNKAPDFIRDNLKNQIIHFNRTFEYRFPPFSDFEGMPVYIYFSCIPSCNLFSYNINNEGIGFFPTQWN